MPETQGAHARIFSQIFSGDQGGKDIKEVHNSQQNGSNLQYPRLSKAQHGPAGRPTCAQYIEISLSLRDSLSRLFDNHADLLSLSLSRSLPNAVETPKRAVCFASVDETIRSAVCSNCRTRTEDIPADLSSSLRS